MDAKHPPRYLLARQHITKMEQYGTAAITGDPDVFPDLRSGPDTDAFLMGVHTVLLVFLNGLDRTAFADLFATALVSQDWIIDEAYSQSILRDHDRNDIAVISMSPYAGVVPHDLYTTLCLYSTATPDVLARSMLIHGRKQMADAILACLTLTPDP